jgi:uncharacterized membrane protein YbhN (UPF0104 family)
MPKVSKRFRTILQLVISAFCLGWVAVQVRALDWNAPIESLRAVSYSYVVGCFTLTALLYAIRLSRLRLWTQQIAPAQLAWREWVGLYLQSIVLGSLSPARLGDFSRIALLVRTGLSSGMRSKIVLLDKLSDFLYVPLALCVAAQVVSAEFEVPAATSGIVAAFFFLGYALAARWLGNFLGVRSVVLGLGLSVLAFVVFVVSNALLFWAVHVELSLPEVTAIVVAVGVLANLPASVGGIGVREASLLAILQSRGVTLEQSTVLVLLEFVLNILWPVALYGIWKCVGASGSSRRAAADGA